MRRADFDQNEVSQVVKGITRRVIVVKAPDPRYFEEAIFIVKEDVSVSGVDAKAVLKEAEAVAARFVKSGGKRSLLKRVPPPVYALIGAGVSGLLFFLLF